jgi:hypothetical protein
MTTEERLKFYCDHVRKAGFIPQMANGEVHFKVEGQLVQIIVDDEEQYFSMVQNRFVVFRDDQAAQAEDAALQTVAATKVAKVWVSGNHASASVELFLQPGDVPALFERLVAVLQYAVDVFGQKMSAKAR